MQKNKQINKQDRQRMKKLHMKLSTKNIHAELIHCIYQQTVSKTIVQQIYTKKYDLNVSSVFTVVDKTLLP